MACPSHANCSLALDEAPHLRRPPLLANTLARHLDGDAMRLPRTAFNSRPGRLKPIRQVWRRDGVTGPLCKVVLCEQPKVSSNRASPRRIKSSFLTRAAVDMCTQLSAARRATITRPIDEAVAHQCFDRPVEFQQLIELRRSSWSTGGSAFFCVTPFPLLGLTVTSCHYQSAHAQHHVLQAPSNQSDPPAPDWPADSAWPLRTLP